MDKRLLLIPPLLAAVFGLALPADAVSQGTAGATLADIAARYFADKMELDPLNASATLAAPRYEGRLTITISPAEVARTRALNERVKSELASVDAATLGERDRLTRELLLGEVQLAIDGDAFPAHLMPINHFGGVPLLPSTLGSGDQLLHEGQPGQHVQMSLQQELGLPDFRKYGWSTAYGEGWALYAETFGRKLGLYDDPNQYLGHLKLELMRAVRLVTDTGLHAKGWTREQSIQYMIDTEGETEAGARNATERYMAFPAQALGYKIGALKFQALRERARLALGDRFSAREFHDLVLSEGIVPLDVLDRMVDAWIARRRANKDA